MKGCCWPKRQSRRNCWPTSENLRGFSSCQKLPKKGFKSDGSHFLTLINGKVLKWRWQCCCEKCYWTVEWKSVCTTRDGIRDMIFLLRSSHTIVHLAVIGSDQKRNEILSTRPIVADHLWWFGYIKGNWLGIWNPYVCFVAFNSLGVYLLVTDKKKYTI